MIEITVIKIKGDRAKVTYKVTSPCGCSFTIKVADMDNLDENELLKQLYERERNG